MTQLAKTHHVDHNVFAELHAKIHGDLGHMQHRFGIVRIHVEDGRLDYLGHVCAIQRRTRISRIGGGKTDLVIDDDVHRTAGAITACLRQIEGLLIHTLPCEGSISMQQDWQYHSALMVATVMLPCPHGSFHHWIDDLKMRRIECQRDMHGAAWGSDIG